jgi:MFS family permease
LLSAVTRDYRLLLATRVVRAFGFGFAAILLGIHLQARGLGSAEVGLVLALGLLSGSLTGLLAAAATKYWGRRRVLAVTGALMAFCGFDLGLANHLALFLLAGLTGMMGVASTDLGPFLAVEQAVLAQSTPDKNRNRAFARYSLTGGLAGAAGGLFASAAGNGHASTSMYFLLYGVAGLVTMVVPLLLSDRVEGEADAPVFGSLKPLLGLSGLFALDALGGGLIVNSVLAYWLHVRFNASPETLGPAFAVTQVLAAFSFELSGRLADRIGLVNTMVFTHLPTSLMLFLIPFMPTLALALAVVIVRGSFQSMDVPARQAYIVSIVKPSERSGALAITGAVRGVCQSFGPIITGAAIQGAVLGVPFFIGGVTKTLYDAGLYSAFRRRFGDHEERLAAT